MVRSISSTEKPQRGRPRTDPVAQHFTMTKEISAALDAYATSSPEPLTRPQAIRAILSDWLAGHGFLKHSAEGPEGAN